MTDLTTRTIRGVAWTLSTSLGSRIVGLIGTLVLARYLAPAEYGEVMAAAIVAVTAFGMTTFGVGIYLLSNRDLTRAEAFHATVWFVATGALAYAVVWALAGAIGPHLDAPELPDYLPLFVVSGMLDRIAFLPERMLIRRLRFRWLSIARAAGELVFTGLSLALAAEGYGARAILWAYLARSILKFLAIVPAVDRREWLEPHRLELATLGRIVRSGLTISIGSIATFVMRRWDNLMVSAFFGNATMGAYNYAYNLADTPAVAIGEQVSDVVAASFPHAEGEERQRALIRACTMISLIMFPLAFGLAAVGPTVVAAFFSAEWASVGGMLVILALMSAPRPMAHIVHAYLFAGQRMRVFAWLEWLTLLAMMAGIATVGRLSIHWTCAVVAVAFALRTLALLYTVRRLDGVPLRRFLLPLLRPLLACVVMVAAILAARPLLSPVSPKLRLALEVALGAAIYLAGAALIFRSTAREFLALVRRAG